jgi:hypothetical protein
LIVTCAATTRAGAPCRSRDGLSADGLCALHDPARAAAVASKRERGARRGKEKSYLKAAELPPPPETIDGCKTWLSWLLEQVVTGALDANAAREATKMVEAKRRALRDDANAEKRMKALEAALARQTKT